MNQITPSMVYYKPPAGIPENLVIYQDENHGLAALLAAAQDMTEGKIVKFAICERCEVGNPEITKVYTFGMGYSYGDRPRAARYCGENDDPDGAGSYALIPSWYDYCANPAAIAAQLSYTFARAGDMFFRLESK